MLIPKIYGFYEVSIVIREIISHLRFTKGHIRWHNIAILTLIQINIWFLRTFVSNKGDN